MQYPQSASSGMPESASEQRDHSLQGKTLLVINTGSLAKRFILQRLKELGLTIVMLNSERNWAQEFVDRWILADTYDRDATVRAVRRHLSHHSSTIDGAITFWEDDVCLLSHICETFGFTGNSSQAALHTRSKYHMQEVLRSSGRPFIPHHLLRSEDDLSVAMESVGFPAVLKPKCGSDSQFVVRVEDEHEARDAYAYLRENCTPKYDPIYWHNQELFVYERFVSGPEFSVECYAQDGIVHAIGVNEKTPMHLPYFMETGDFCPARISPAQRTALMEEAVAALQALGVRDSLAHVELKMTPHGPQVIEAASRMGGVYVQRNIREVFGFDLIKAGCQIALHLPVTESVSQSQTHLLAQFIIPEQSGVVTHLQGFEALHREPGFVDFHLFKKEGEAIAVPPDGFDAAAWVLVRGSSPEEAEYRMRRILRSVEVKVDAVPQQQPVQATLVPASVFS